MGYEPLREYAIVGNDDRFALVDRDCSIDWCCFPHGAAPSVFAGLLDADSGGHFSVNPTDTAETERSYRNRTNVLDTTFETRSGRTTVTDFMPVSRDGQPDRDQHAIYRRVECTEGATTLELACHPRFDYARDVPTVEATDEGFVVNGEDEYLSLQIHGSFDVRAVDDGVVGVDTLREGNVVWIVLQYDHVTQRSPSSCRTALEETTRYWESWIAELLETATDVVGGKPWMEEVVRSSLLLKLLINDGTGAIYAAPTTSLPESYDSTRNWDYRHNWMRDAKFTIQALHNLGRSDEAHRYFEWFRSISHEGPSSIQPVYGVHGEADLTEYELDHLSGYRHTGPVRIGNAAADQHQHDVYGSIVQGFYETLRHDEQASEEDWESIRDIVDYVCDIWDEPDDGIWEVRDRPRHYVHSKLLCWVALDRGIELAEARERDGNVERWHEERDRVREAILEHGYDESVGSFVQHFETDRALDATCLLIPIYEFLPPGDDRVQSTIDTVVDRLLTEQGLVCRTTDSDALPEEQGAFVLCTFWLVDALVLAGRVEEARDIFEGVLEYASPLGLLSERIEPETGELMGNYPQAFSHIGLVNSAVYLASAEGEPGDLPHDPEDTDGPVDPIFRTDSG